MSQNKTIFVAIAAFNDPYVKQTIESAQSQAEHPERIFFGINLQSTDGCFEDITSLKNVRVRHSIVNKPSGFGIERLIADSFWDCEDYYLQIDAHMLFEKNWDSDLISTHQNLVNNGVEKPIISTFVPWWSVDETGEILHYNPGSIDCCNVCSYSLESIDKNWIEPKRSWKSSVCGESVVEHGTICGHFMFTSSLWLEEVGHDWRFIFIGDEHLVALRSHTRGYRMFSTGKPFVWHFNKEDKFKSNDWHLMAANSNLDRNSKRFEKDKIRQKNIFTGKLLNDSGAPTLESLTEYLRFVEFDVINLYSEIEKK